MIEKTLAKAIEMEEKGHKFYKESAKMGTNEITRKTFEFLAENELLHIESIRKFYESLKNSRELPSINFSELKNKRNQDLTLFSKNISELKDKVKESDTDKKAVEFAMEFENTGYRYYEGMLKEATDVKLTALLKFLLSEESAHYEGLSKLDQYLTDSHNWYMYDEESFPQG